MPIDVCRRGNEVGRHERLTAGIESEHIQARSRAVEPRCGNTATKVVTEDAIFRALDPTRSGARVSGIEVQAPRIPASDDGRHDRVADQLRISACGTLQPEPDWITLGHCPSQINSLGS